MIRFIFIVSLLGSVSYGCKMNWVFGESSKGCVMVDGKKREFRYFMPSHAKGVVLPLVIGLHGGGGKPKQFESYSRFSELSEKSASYIAVYPKGIDKHWNDGRSNLNEKVDDVAFISKLIDILPHIDKSEVYATGMSNGALMTQRLACEISSKLNGIAVVGASMSNELVQNCVDNKAMDALFVFGTKDTAFLDNGTIVSPLSPNEVRGHHISIDKTLQYWKERNACKSVSLKKELNLYTKQWGKLKDDGTKVFINEYKGCRKRLMYYKVEGGGHRWPDSEASNGFIIRKAMKVGNASHEINSAEEIINFFRLIKR